jgi:hypothetical protein
LRIKSCMPQKHPPARMARSVDDVMAFPFTIAEVGQVCATVDVDQQRFMQTGTDRLTYSAAPPRIELISDERGASMAMHWRSALSDPVYRR